MYTEVHRGGVRLNCYEEANLGFRRQSPLVGLQWVMLFSPYRAHISLLKMTEKLILIILLRESAQYFLIFPFFETLRGRACGCTCIKVYKAEDKLIGAKDAYNL